MHRVVFRSGPTNFLRKISHHIHTKTSLIAQRHFSKKESQEQVLSFSEFKSKRCKSFSEFKTWAHKAGHMDEKGLHDAYNRYSNSSYSMYKYELDRAPGASLPFPFE